MILQALTAYYEQLLKQGKVEAPGWDSRFKVSYELRLGPDGQLLALNDLRQEVPKGKKTVIAPRELPVPHRVKRASGVAANFLCDNTSYLLGADEKGKPERSRQCFEACAALHHKVLDGVDSPAAKAILAFFDSWEPDTAPTHPLLAEQWADLNNNANLVFGYESPDGAHWLATTDDAIRAAWQSAFDTSDADAETARCLITGKEAGIARIHPAIKGVMGAQAADAALVSFHTLKPFDDELARTYAAKCGKVFTVEEHSIIGGLGDAVASAICGMGLKHFEKIGINDVFGQSGKPAALLEEYGLTGKQIADRIAKA